MAVPRRPAKCSEFGKAPQLDDIIGESWTSLALEKSPDLRWVGTLLTEAGADGSHEGKTHRSAVSKEGTQPEDGQVEELNDRGVREMKSGDTESGECGGNRNDG